MAAPTRKSGWGSFLQQAVAGVEAHLDNILSEQQAQAANTPARITQSPPPPTAASGLPPTARHSDRLQERLARAVASRTPSASGSTRQSQETSDDASPKRSPEDSNPPPTVSAIANPTPSDANGIATDHTPVNERAVGLDTNNETTLASGNGASESAAEDDLSPTGDSPSVDHKPYILVDKAGTAGEQDSHNCSKCNALEAEILALRASLEEETERHTKESHTSIERFDALEAKLQFLTQEKAEASRNAAAHATPGSLEKTIAEKDEKIALLMAEGQNLAGMEQKHRAIIKKLRATVAENNKTISDLKSNTRTLVAERDNLRTLASQVKQLETLNRDVNNSAETLRRDVASLQRELNEKDQRISNLVAELARTKENTTAAAERAANNATEARRFKDLEESLASLRLERDLALERAKTREAELVKQAEREAERSRAIEVEMKGELQAMESKLEVMRASVEEASSNSSDESHAKLLRQVDTLQTQYAIASENWQGIEASLLSRVSTLEVEKDDASKRESDMRKRAREMSSRCRKQEDEIQSLKTSLLEHRHKAEAASQELELVRATAENAEAALLEAKKEFERRQAQIKEEKSGPANLLRSPSDVHPAELARSHSRPRTPLFPSRMMSSDSGSFARLQGQHEERERTMNVTSPRSMSIQLAANDMMSPGASELASSFGFPVINSPAESLPESVAQGNEPPRTSAGLDHSPSMPNFTQDVVSVSTVAAGPSIQLVERMSAGIRRLEAERIANREELSRISSQRDEARTELATLMKELEQSRASQHKVAALEADLSDLNTRYQATLEMLGEKSELVEELKADVQDVKEMYRDLVERTLK